MKLREYLTKRLAELEAEHVELVEAERITREQITKADQKRGTEKGTEYYHKWSEILRNLESDLDKTRSKLNAVKAEITDKSRKLKEAEEAAKAEEERRARLARDIESMTPEELAELSEEDLAYLQQVDLATQKAAPAEPRHEQEEPGSEESPEESPEEAAGRKRREAEEREAARKAAAQERLKQTIAQGVATLKEAAGKEPSDITLGQFGALIDLYGIVLQHHEGEQSFRKPLVAVLKKLDAETIRCMQKLDKILGSGKLE